MVKIGEKYECLICNKIVEIVEVGSTLPVCCEQDMKLTHIAHDELKVKDKNICGMLLKCEACGLKLRILQDGMGSLSHCIDDMVMVKTQDIEIGNIYKCNSCGKIVKIQKSGCGEIHCCDYELCVMDVTEVNDLKKKVEITVDASKDKPYDHKFYICKSCGREVEILEESEGDLICHGTKMDETKRIRYYFQGGG